VTLTRRLKIAFTRAGLPGHNAIYFKNTTSEVGIVNTCQLQIRSVASDGISCMATLHKSLPPWNHSVSACVAFVPNNLRLPISAQLEAALSKSEQTALISVTVDVAAVNHSAIAKRHVKVAVGRATSIVQTAFCSGRPTHSDVTTLIDQMIQIWSAPAPDWCFPPSIFRRHRSAPIHAMREMDKESRIGPRLTLARSRSVRGSLRSPVMVRSLVAEEATMKLRRSSSDRIRPCRQLKEANIHCLRFISPVHALAD
jgi:hypothetical protein